MEWIIAGTWRFARIGLAEAVPLLERGMAAIEAVEAAVRVVESDESVESVGVGGGPNALGEIELDAALMDGRTLSMGAVGALMGIRHPVSVAARLMKTRQTFLAGEGAQRFARANGFVVEDLHTAASRERFNKAISETKNGAQAVSEGHDTVGIVARDAQGHFAAGTSTSGLFLKPKGRLGDSPLPGCGFYADDELGASVATGMGEDLMRGAVCLRALLMAADGMPPARAAAAVLGALAERRRSAGFAVGDISLLLMNAQGEVGAATNIPEDKDGFPYAFARGGDTGVAVLKGRLI